MKLKWKHTALAAAVSGALSGALTLAAAQSAGTPYAGSPIALPGTFEAENFDKGGDNVGYLDLSAGNSGGAYRTGESVDIVASRDAEGGAYVVNYFQTGEWLAYTVEVPADGLYDIEIRAANKNLSGAGFHVEVDGVNVTGKIAVPATGGWHKFDWFGKKGVPLKAGRHVLKIVSDQEYFDVNQVRVSAAPGTPSYAGTPFGGKPIAVPAAFEAEDFDRGGADVAYRDLSGGNTGGQYRTDEAVDIIASRDPEGGGYAVNYFQTGEWLAYTLEVPADGLYDIEIRAANKRMSGAAFHAEIDGVDVTGKVAVPSTDAWDQFVWVGKKGVPLKAGKRILKIVSDQEYFDVNRIRVVAAGSGNPPTPPYTYAGTPFTGTPIAVPKAFEAEDFDRGGNNIAYKDATPGNAGGQYRTDESVDIVASGDPAGGGHVVNYFESGEWLAYTLQVPADGLYDISIRAANRDFPDAAFRAEIDGVDVTGKVAVPQTGGWHDFVWVGKGGVPLKAGKRILKIVAEQQYFDVNMVSVLAAGTKPPSPPQNQPPSVSFKAPSDGAKIAGLINSSTCEVSATDDVKVVKVEFLLGGTVVGAKTSAPWQCAIDTTKFPDGGYQLKAVAYDDQGASKAAEVAVTVANGGSDDPPPSSGNKPSSLLFWSGFEGNVAPGTPYDCYRNGCYQDINGSDSWTGFTWPPKVNNGRARYQMLANSGNNPGPEGIFKYMWNEVQTVTGPKGTKTRAMYSHIAQAGGGSTQLPYLIFPDGDVKEMYISQWVKLQPDMVEKMKAGTWRDLFEVKTTDTDHRIELQIRTVGSNKPYWMVRTDTYVPSHRDIWRIYNHDVPVPVGEWFKLETYFKRSTGSDGRVWMAVNGKVLADRWGPTVGPNRSPVNRIFVNQLYSGSAYPIYQWIDNVQVWSTFPTAKSGDAWYDPPYAPH